MNSTTRERREAAARQLIAESRLRLEQRGCAWRIFGAGVDLVVSDLSTIDARALEPHPARRRGADE